jgi:hypothetical protein
VKKTMPANYTIEMWSFPVVVQGSPFLHNYLVMKDGNGNTVRELHGGARDPVTGNLQVTAVTGTAGFKEGIAGQTGTYAENPVVSQGPLLEAGTRREAVLQEGTQADINNRWAAMKETTFSAASLATTRLMVERASILPPSLPTG